MKVKFGMSLFINIAWLCVGGILTFWIGPNQISWLVVGILVTLIGVTGINLAIAEKKDNEKRIKKADNLAQDWP